MGVGWLRYIFLWLTLIEWCFSVVHLGAYKTIESTFFIWTVLDLDMISMKSGWAIGLDPCGWTNQLRYEFGCGNKYWENTEKKYSEIIKLYHRVHPVYPFVRFLFPLYCAIDLGFLWPWPCPCIRSIFQSQADGSAIRPDTHHRFITETETSVMVLKYFRPGPVPNANTWIDNKVRWWSVSHHKNHNNWPKTNHYHPVRIQNHSNNDENG